MPPFNFDPRTPLTQTYDVSICLDRRDRFLILATDGLWERVTNEEAVSAVERFHHYHPPPPEEKGCVRACISLSLS